MRSGKALWGGLLMTAAVASATAQTPNLVWESVFDQPLTSSPWILYSAPPNAVVPDPIRLTSAPGGDYYLHAPDWTGKATVSRLSALDDSVVWRRIVSGSWIYMSGGRLSDRSIGDGEAWVVAGGIARFSADGEFLWSRAADAAYLDGPASVHRFSNGNLLLSSADRSGTLRNRFSRIDSTTGAIVGGFVLPEPSSACAIQVLGIDPEDALYVATTCQADGQRITTVSRLAPDLSVLWTHALPPDSTFYVEEGRLLIDSAAVYLQFWGAGEPGLMRLSASDGSQSWFKPGVWADLRLDASGRILGSLWSGASHRVDLIDPANGQLLWTYEMAARDVHVDVAADGIYLVGIDHDQTYGIADKLDPASGARVWRRSLVGPLTGGYFRPSAVLATAAAVRVAGADCRPDAECRIGVVSIDRATGTASPIVYPSVPQTALGSVIEDGDDHVLAYALEPAPVSALTPDALRQQIRVRRIDMASTVEWERVFPIGTLERLDVAHVARTGDGDLLVVANTRRVTPSWQRHAYIAKYSADGEHLRWERHLLDEPEVGGIDFAVESDPSGNLFLGASSALYSPAISGYVRERSLSLLDAASGEVRWSRELTVATPELVGSAPYFRVAGADVVMLESPATMAPGAVVRLSGADGATVWASTELATPGADLIAMDASEGFMRDAGNGVKAFSLATGLVEWTYRYVYPFGTSGTVLSVAVGDDGDVYLGGSRANGSGWTARVARDSGVPVWVHHFDAAVGAVHARAIVRDAAQGHVHITQRRGVELFLTRLDQQTGAFVDSSLLSRSPIGDEAIPDDGAAYLRRMTDGQILAPGTAYRPGEALRPWVGRLAAPSAGVRGNLALSLMVSPAVGTPADTRTLTMPIAYSGDGAISDAIALVALDAGVTGRNDRLAVDALDCTTTGSGHCSAVATPSGVRLHLDLVPGATATLTAQLRALAPSGLISAKVHAPYGLFESDMLDNEASVAVSADRLFVDGFE